MTIPTTDAARVPRLETRWSASDTLGAWKVRWGIGRDSYRVEPGLYRVGDPGTYSPVLATCNYKLTIDIVRRDLEGIDAWVLVLETRGVNVWCAAGKGTFGTAEMIHRLLTSDLALLVDHTTIVVPQLGATGVAAHEVRQATGWRVVFGPVRSADLPEFLESGMEATPAMRAVTFTLPERAVLAPVELVGSLSGYRALAPIALAALGLALGFFRPDVIGQPSAVWLPLAAHAGGVLGGSVVVPIALPWLPGRAFAMKGAFAGAVLGAVAGVALGAGPVAIAAAVLAAGALASYIGLNFTGSTPYTSPSGVEKELRRWLPIQAVSMVAALVLLLVQSYV